MHKTHFVFMCKKNKSKANKIIVFHLYTSSEGFHLYGWDNKIQNIYSPWATSKPGINNTLSNCDVIKVTL